MITILDGGMGQELIARSTSEPTYLWATKVMMDQPELVRQVHDDFFAAGASVATTNTYAIHHDRLIPVGLDDQFAALHETACKVAGAARDSACASACDSGGGGQVAGAIGPLVGSYRTDPLPEDAVAHFTEICQIQAPFVDFFLYETVSTVEQVRAALEGAAQANMKLADKALAKPVWIAVSVDDEDGTMLRSGEALADVVPLIEAADHAAALLINCTTPESVTKGVDVIKGTSKPFGAYANGFTRITQSFVQEGATVRELSARTDLTPDAYAAFAEDWAQKGATIIGGCCEVGPAHIQEIARRLTKT